VDTNDKKQLNPLTWLKSKKVVPEIIEEESVENIISDQKR